MSPRDRGNSVFLTLKRGTMDSRMFAGLRGSLVARFIDERGAADEVKLTFQNDRYVTEAVRMADPGSLKVEVDIALDSMRLRYAGQIEIRQVVPRLLVLAQPACRGHRATAVRRHRNDEDRCRRGNERGDGAAGNATGRDSAGRARAAMPRAGHGRATTPPRRAGPVAESLGSDGFPPAPWPAGVFRPIAGRQGHPAPVDGLADRGRGCPFELGLAIRVGEQWQPAGNPGGWAPFLPSWLVTAPSCYAIIKSKPSPFSTYYLSGGCVDGEEVRFDAANAWYVHPVSASGDIEFVGRMQAYDATNFSGRTLPEIQVRYRDHLRLPVQARWGGISLAAAFLAAAAVAAVWLLGRIYAFILRLDVYKILLFGGDQPDSQDVVRTHCFWPDRTLLVCKEGSQYRLAHRSEVPRNATSLPAFGET